MTGENLLIVAFIVGLWPFMVLMIAITGPHSAAEKRDYAEYRASRRVRSTPPSPCVRDRA